MWGNLNDGDYADYYNYIFTSFASAQVTNPDNSSETYDYASSNGIGIARCDYLLRKGYLS